MVSNRNLLLKLKIFVWSCPRLFCSIGCTFHHPRCQGHWHGGSTRAHGTDGGLMVGRWVGWTRPTGGLKNTAEGGSGGDDVGPHVSTIRWDGYTKMSPNCFKTFRRRWTSQPPCLRFSEKKLGGEEQNEKGTFLKYRCVLGVVIFFLNVTSQGDFSSLEGEVLQVARFPRHIFFGSWDLF